MFNLPSPLDFFSAQTWIIINVLVIVLLMTTAITSRARQAARQPLRQNLWLALTFILTLLWLTRAHVLDLLYLHLIGASLAYLLLGAPLALLALALILLVTNITLGNSLYQFGLQYLLVGLLPIINAQILHIIARRIFPRRLFTFIFIQGFFVATLGMIITATLNLFVLQQLHIITLNLGNEVFWISPVLLGWGEGLLSGMAVALIAAYKPHWLFEDPQLTNF